MPAFLSLLALLGTTLLFSAAAHGQSRLQPVPLPSPLRDAGTYHVASGTWTRAGSTYGLPGQDALYRNDIGASYFGLLGVGETATDEGRLPGAGQPLLGGAQEVGTSDLYTITGFRMSYCALGAGPTTYDLSFLESYTSCTSPAGTTPVATLHVTGLPASGCWIVALDLSGTSAVFDLAADGGDGYQGNDDLDSFGFSYSFDDGSGGAPSAGPILAGSSLLSDEGNGTKFKNPGFPGSGLASKDQFWLTSPTLADGCYFYGGSCSPCATANMALFGEDSARPTTSTCSPPSANSVSPGGAVLASGVGYLTSQAAFHVGDVPDQPGILFSGGPVMESPFGCGRRCVGGGGVQRYGPFVASGNQLDAVIDMSLSSNTSVQYWYRDPAYQPVCLDTFNLSNALGL